jgi:hypothetical protein
MRDEALANVDKLTLLNVPMAYAHAANVDIPQEELRSWQMQVRMVQKVLSLKVIISKGHYLEWYRKYYH